MVPTRCSDFVVEHVFFFTVAVQGLGGGGIMNLVNIIVSDLVPLAERGLYQGMIVLTWSLACGIGPPIVSDCWSSVLRTPLIRSTV